MSVTCLSLRECVEASLIVEDSSVTLVLRDTGVVLDATDADLPVTSLRRFVIASVMREQQSRRYLNTVGCNRAVLVFRRDKSGPTGL